MAHTLSPAPHSSPPFLHTPRSLPASLFKAYDIRGVVGRTLDEDAVYRIARALGERVRGAGRDTMVVGRDARLSGAALAAALVRGLGDSGCRVVDIGVTPTPLVYFALDHLGIGCGVALTGSHNPPDHNGLKIVMDERPFYGEALQQLRDEAGAQPGLCDAPPLESTGTGAPQSAKAEAATAQAAVERAYSERVCAGIRIARPLHVVVDCGNGVAGGVAPALYRALGMKVSELYCEVDGRFPNHHPDPGRPENLAELARTVSARGADFGLAFDGDGDRLGVVGPDGAIVWPDRLMILFARDVLRQQPGARVIYDVKCSQALAHAITESGGVPEMWKTGHSLIKVRMRQTGAPLAGEFSGHFFFAERWHGADDALYAGARLCEILAHAADTAAIRDMLAALPDSANTPSIELPVADGEQHALARQLAERAAFPGRPDARVTTIDGLRVDFDDGFALIRASNTTPVLILRFEGRDRAALAAIQQCFKAFIRCVAPQLELPF